MRRHAYMLLVLALALGVRLAVSSRPIWFDEACSFWEAKAAPEITPMVSITPLPGIILRPFAGRFDSPWMLRLPFLLIGLASIAIFARAVREWEDDETARFAALLLALAPFHVWYSTETRMYAPLFLASSIQFFYFVRALRGSGAKNWGGYAAGAALGVAFHPFTWFLVAAQGSYLLVRRRSLLVRWALASALAALLSAPATWYALTVHGMTHDKIGWITHRPLMGVVGTFYSFVMGLVFVPAPWWWAITIAAALSFGLLAVRGLAGRGALLPATCLFLPLAFVFVGSLVKDIYSDQTTRYIAFSQPFLLMLVARGCRAFGPPLRRNASMAAAVVIFAAALSPIFLLWDQVGTGSYDKAAEALRESARPEDVVVCSPIVGLPVAYYLRDDLYRRFELRTTRDGSFVPPASPRFWVLRVSYRSTFDFLRSRDDSPPPPEALEGCRLVGYKAWPGRRAISLSLFERS